MDALEKHIFRKYKVKKLVMQELEYNNLSQDQWLSFERSPENPEGKSLFIFAQSLSEHARHVEMGYPLKDYEIAILYLLLNN